MFLLATAVDWPPPASLLLSSVLRWWIALADPVPDVKKYLSSFLSAEGFLFD